MRADNRQQHVALRHLGVELLHKVAARLHGVDVHEYVAPGKFCGQMIEQPPGDAGRVIAPVVDENPRHATA
jgi:hypothetical protein